MSPSFPESTQLKTMVGLGEILFDLLPAGKQLGGAPANFAYHAQALGAKAFVITRVGSDSLGREILDRLRSSGIGTDVVSIDPTYPTGTVAVDLSREGQPRFTIHENVAWDKIEATADAISLMARCDVVCFGSLCQRTASAREAILALVGATRPGALRIFDINLRQRFFSQQVIERSLELADVLKINDQELPILAGMFRLSGEERAQLQQLATRFDLAAVALTRGARGSTLYCQGKFSDHAGIPTQVVDAVGAGDAFTAAMATGLLMGCELDEINRRANLLASYVCSQPGATPLIPDELKSLFVPQPR